MESEAFVVRERLLKDGTRNSLLGAPLQVEVSDSFGWLRVVVEAGLTTNTKY